MKRYGTLFLPSDLCRGVSFAICGGLAFVLPTDRGVNHRECGYARRAESACIVGQFNRSLKGELSLIGFVKSRQHDPVSS